MHKAIFCLRLLILGICLLPGVGVAATKYWIGPPGGAFANNAHWSSTASACGVNPTTAPSAADVATFTAACTNSAAMASAVDVAGINIVAGYTGTITQNTGVTINVGFSTYKQAAGTFAGGNSAITLNGSFNLSGGTFTSTSLTLVAVDGWTHAGGTFNHNNGTVQFGNGAGRTLTANVAISETFNNLVSDHDQDSKTTIQGGAATLIVLGTFTHSGGYLQAGTIEARGPVVVGTLANGYSTTISFLVGGDQTITSSGGYTAVLNINKPSGTVSVSGDLKIGGLTLTSGTFTAPSGTLSVVPANASGSWTRTGAGTFNHNNGTVQFINYDWLEMTLTGSQIFNHLTLGNSTMYDGTLTLAGGATLTVNGTLTFIGLSSLVNGGTILANGDIFLSEAGAAGTTNITFSGTAAQTWSGAAGATMPGAAVTVNKTSGTVTLASNMLLGTSQALNIVSGTLSQGPSYALRAGPVTVSAAGSWTNTGSGASVFTSVTVNSGGLWTHTGSGAVTLGGTLTNSGSITVGSHPTVCSVPIILIRSSVDGTQRSWNGSGVFTIENVDVKDMGGNATITAYSSTARTNMGGNWTFNPAPSSPLAPATSCNYALDLNGGVATASSTYNANYSASATNNGDRSGAPSEVNGRWTSSAATFPQWLQVNFNGSKTITEIDVFHLQDAYLSPSTPTLAMTFSSYGMTSFQTQYWTGAAWADVTGGNVTGNDKVWRQFTFPALTTDRIRVLANAAPDNWSRLVEVEAWGTAVLAASTPGAFNAFESATAAGEVNGVIHTKQAGTVPFTFAVVALNTDSSAVLTTFTGNVKVELVDASDSSGALSGNCRASWVPIAATTLSFAAGNAGRKNVSLSAADAYRDVRVRMSSPALGPPTLVSCSTDNFAVRPYEFANFSVTDGDWQSAGTARALDNAAAAGGVVHKAGQPFTLGATAVGDNGATTAGYNGSPTLTPTVCGGSACLPGLGALAPLTSPAATNGVLAGNTTYSEAGSFALQLVDTSFAAVDAADGSTLAERTIASPVINVGRFVPDHFEINPLAAPVLQTFGSACASRAFTYVGQPFGYATLPQATLVAKNAGGGTTANYQGALWPLSAANVGQSYAPTPASPPLDVSGISAPTLASNGNGSGTIAGKAADKLSFTRDPLLAPLAPFAANIALTWSVSDASEAGVAGNGTITTPTPLSFANIGFDAGNELRFGVLHIASAYGSDLLDLPVPVEARYWNGVRWTTNAADHCTALSTSTVAMGTYQSNLAACETAISPGTLSLVNGRTVVKLARPGNGNTGSVDLTLQLASVAAGLTCTAIGNAASALSATAANLPWLQGKWSGASFNQNPTARASFGQFGRPRSPIIYQRENY